MPYRLIVERDVDPMSPSEWENTDVFLVADIRRYLEVQPPKLNGRRLSSDPDEWHAAGFIVFRLYAYVHGGVALSLSRFGDVFGSGLAGFVAVKGPIECSDEWRAGRTDGEIARVMAEAVVSEWNDFLSGNIYQYRIESVETCNLGHEHADTVDSCSGFHGEADARVEGQNALDALIRRMDSIDNT